MVNRIKLLQLQKGFPNFNFLQAIVLVIALILGSPSFSLSQGSADLLDLKATDPTDLNATDLKAIETQFLALINELRASHGLNPLAASTELHQAATFHSRYLVEIDSLSHSGPGGESVFDRVVKTGYRVWEVAENIAMGQPNVETVFRGWKSSPGHLKNMLNPRLKELGLAVAINEKSKWKYFWVLDIAVAR